MIQFLSRFLSIHMLMKFLSFLFEDSSEAISQVYIYFSQLDQQFDFFDFIWIQPIFVVVKFDKVSVFLVRWANSFEKLAQFDCVILILFDPDFARNIFYFRFLNLWRLQQYLVLFVVYISYLSGLFLD